MDTTKDKSGSIPFLAQPGDAPEVLPFGAPNVTAGAGNKVDPAKLSEEVLTTRAIKNHMALGEKSPGPHELRRLEELGMLDHVVTNAAREDDVRKMQARADIVKELSLGASKEGRRLSPIEEETIYALTSADMQSLRTDPESFLQKEYARRVVSLATARGVENPFEVSARGNPQETFNVVDTTQDFIAKREGFSRIAEDAASVAKEQSWAGYLVDVAKELVPFYTWAKTKDAVQDYTGVNAPITSKLPGNNLEEQISYLYSLPADQANRLAKETVDGLLQDNPQLAARFASALVSYGHANLDNILIAGVDVLSVGLAAPVRAIGKAAATGVAKSGKAAVRASTGLLEGTGKGAKIYEALKPLAQAATMRKPTAAKVADAAGDTVDSAMYSTVKNLEGWRGEIAGRSAKEWNDLDNAVQSFMNPQAVLDGPRFSLSTEAATRLVGQVKSFSDDFLSKLYTDPLQTASRVTPNVLRKASEEAFDLFSRQYRRLEDSVLDVERVIGSNPGLSVRLGRNNGELFNTEAQAMIYIDDVYGLKDAAVVRPRGSAFYIEVFKPFDLSTPGIAKARKLDIASDTIPTANALGKYLVRMRSGEDTLPPSVREAFKRSVYGGSALLKVIGDEAKNIAKLKDPSDFYDFLRHQQTMKNPKNPEKLGYFSKTLGEFEIQWASRFNRLPTEQEASAYFAYTKINDAHYLYLNNSYYTAKTSLGLQHNSIKGITQDLEGRIAAALPGPKDPAARVLVIGEDNVPWYFNTARSLSAREGKEIKPREEIDNLLNNGYQILQLSPTGQRVLTSLDEVSDVLKGRGAPHFIIAKQVDSKPLPFQQIPYAPGGHHMYPEGFFVRQAQIYPSEGGKRTIYYGDVNIFQSLSKEAAERVSTRMEEARVLMRGLYNAKGAKVKNADPLAIAAFENFVKNNLPISVKEFKGMFFGKGATLDIRAPIMYSSNDVSLAAARDLKSISLVDGVKPTEFVKDSDSPYNLYRGIPNLQYAMERGDVLREVAMMGSKDNPVLGIRPGTLLDPIAAVSRSLESMRHGMYLEDLRMTTSERFLAEFDDLLDLTDPKYAADKFLAATDAPFKKVSSENRDRLAQAEVFRDRFKQFLGFRNNAENQAAAFAEKILDGRSPDLATGWRKSLYEVLAEPRTTVDKLKQLAFHMKIGLWNPKQLVLQANTTAHIAGIVGPVNGSKAAAAAMVQNIIMHGGDDLTEAGAKLVKTFGWTEETFKEAVNAMKRTGYDNVGKEVATREQHLRGRVIDTKVGQVLDHGLFFFKKGEEFVRRASWNAAYLEWRQANPNAKLTDTMISRILDRADTLNVNMSQASNAGWQQGLLSIPTQFMSYPVRITEQLLGKRLTNAEKRRLLVTYSALYGVPVTTAVSSFGLLPSHKALKSYLYDQNIDLEDNLVLNAMNEGIIGLLSDAAMGEDVNAQTVMGPYGSSILNDFMYGDKQGWELMMGASGSVLGETMAASVPVVKWMWSLANPFADETYPITLQEITNVFSPVTTMSMTEKAIVGFATGNYYTRKGDLIDKGNGGISGVLKAYLGVSPQKIDDLYILVSNDKNRKEFVNKQSRFVKAEFEKMLKASSREEAEGYHRNMMTRMITLEPRERDSVLRQALEPQRSLMERQFLIRQPKSEEQREFNMKLMNKWGIN